MSPGTRVIGRKAHENEIFSNFCLRRIISGIFQDPLISMSLSHKQESVYRLQKNLSPVFFLFSFPFQPTAFLFLPAHFFPLPCPPKYSFPCIVTGGRICLATALSCLLASKSHDECGSLHFLFFVFKGDLVSLP